MDDNIQVCAVYTDGTVRIYGEKVKDFPRRLLTVLKFKTYGAALDFAVTFEENQCKSKKIEK